MTKFRTIKVEHPFKNQDGYIETTSSEKDAVIGFDDSMTAEVSMEDAYGEYATDECVKDDKVYSKFVERAMEAVRTIVNPLIEIQAIEETCVDILGVLSYTQVGKTVHMELEPNAQVLINGEEINWETEVISLSGLVSLSLVGEHIETLIDLDLGETTTTKLASLENFTNYFSNKAQKFDDSNSKVDCAGDYSQQQAPEIDSTIHQAAAGKGISEQVRQAQQQVADSLKSLPHGLGMPVNGAGYNYPPLTYTAPSYPIPAPSYTDYVQYSGSFGYIPANQMNAAGSPTPISISYTPAEQGFLNPQIEYEGPDNMVGNTQQGGNNSLVGFAGVLSEGEPIFMANSAAVVRVKL